VTDSPIDLLALMPFAQTLGVELLVAKPDEVRARLDWHERLCTAGGVFHGGALCAYLNLPGTASTTTIESKTNFLRAVTAPHVDGISRPLQRGRRIIVVETDLIDDHARLVARVTQSQLVLPLSVGRGP
jgi:1,4-dihydroxy-2-naphthoyl-CoA hydrolase